MEHKYKSQIAELEESYNKNREMIETDHSDKESKLIEQVDETKALY